MKRSGELSSSARKAIGRPRRLTLAQIIRAGMELGLQDLSVSAIALKLGVSAGVIYTYVDGFDELRRLIVLALSERPTLVEEGQHWAKIVRDYAAMLFQVLSNEPELTAQVVSGAVSPEEGVAELENFLALLVHRDFTVEAAFDLYSTTGQIVVGAAISRVMARAWERRGEPRRTALLRAMAEQPANALPHIRSLGAKYTDQNPASDYAPMLERMLSDMADERGEPLPTEQIQGRDF
jgi:AcrR family transcriptional regulator